MHTSAPRPQHEAPDESGIPEAFRLSSYAYELPESQIARRPAERRDASRLLFLDRQTEAPRADEFANLPELLAAKFPQGGLLIANNTRVFPARIYGRRATGGRVELLLLTPLPLLHVKPLPDGRQSAEAEGLVRTAKRMKEGETALFDAPQGMAFSVTLLERGEYGRCRLRLEWQGDIGVILNEIGHMPLPPYLEREDDAADRERYQTTYANAAKAGSVAAPTAGLHFTPEVRGRLEARGFKWAEVTLYVGYGTFSPVRAADIRTHEMHKEYVEVPEETAAAIREAKAAGLPVIAVGTTSARSLEGMFAAQGRVASFAGETGIYIYPGRNFNVVDALITNFHLPESSLLIMVSALVGRERIMAAYALALAQGFRFFSYGDAMLIV
ncbi:MAG TPA: tRNA preQ1(34) S-adenosylmethionine ribosyltransferase-isomerase QueA [Humidesulfovibrio sp.]|uniref:tRNA preQ1(34) S-adenosylmethionine ribosyltransferase-isomerase QueA n=1 Tax=Humidesulfovibrio sp. TaxID=2910988 RepID=UPI002C57BC9B|nr:tRNA preQ1(34) S-adenosylmethionine ribosyltransferase-isomerase QueA [Humidesulfovibrio sp.]HWR05213.1 tRNA preQ1(34) S-adenosylmethionine ribosyltransferase-isomerase QueA [Humidesulfovibrio sp.]